MDSAKVIQLVANIVATVLASLATTDVFPHLTAVFAAVSGLLVGWVNAQKPGASAKAVLVAEGKKALAEQETSK